MSDQENQTRAEPREGTQPMPAYPFPTHNELSIGRCANGWFIRSPSPGSPADIHVARDPKELGMLVEAWGFAQMYPTAPDPSLNRAGPPTVSPRG